MNRFLLKNDTTENVSARVTVSPSDELGNLGHDAATVIEGDRLTTCLAPTAVDLPEPTGHRSQCFELNDNGRYAVEINGVVQPYAFTPADLMDCFNGQHESQVRFLECMRPAISCDGANSQVSVFMSLPWQGESGGAINLYNDETNELISEIQGYYLNPPDYNMADRLSPDVTYITANSEGNSTQTDYGNYRVTQQLISYRNTTDNPVRLRFEILHSSENEFPKTIFTEETEFHHNPTLFLIEETQDYSVYGVCLAPAEDKPEISCDGATDSARLTDGSGTWNIELNGKLYVSPDGYGLGYFIHQTPELNAEIEGGGDGDFQFHNVSTTKHQRIRIIPVDGSSWEIHPGNNNPTVAVNDDGSISLCLAPTRPEITCDGAVPVFEAKTSFETNVIEVSVDGGPWSDIYSAEGIFVSFVPGNPGADIRFNLEGSDPKRVRVRTSRDIGLYVNPISGFDQINTNKAYTLYDRDGNIIDAFDPKNQDHSGREFDDTGTTDDFAVFFAEAEFCLATEPSPTYAIRLEGESSLKEMFENNISSEKHRDTKVVELEFYEGLEIISMQAFSDCSISGELTFSDSVWLIGQNAFLRNNISEITLGSGIKRLGNYAFRDNKITTIHIYATTPPEIESESWPPFEGNVIEKIYVPTSVVDAYKSAPYWSTFADKIFGF